METLIDFKKFRQLIKSKPEQEPLLENKTDGFKLLYEKVYLVLLNEQTEYSFIDVDIERFDFDDLVDFNEFLIEKCRIDKNPILFFDNILSDLNSIRRKMSYI